VTGKRVLCRCGHQRERAPVPAADALHVRRMSSGAARASSSAMPAPGSSRDSRSGIVARFPAAIGPSSVTSTRGSDKSVLGVCDVDILIVDIARNSYSTVSVVLRSASDYDAFAKAVQTNPTLHLEPATRGGG